ncbi:MAG: hypothetical protein WCT04_24860 [Planctomycetota bacterium]
MPREKHTGQTETGHTRDINVERVGKVTILQARLDPLPLFLRERQEHSAAC